MANNFKKYQPTIDTSKVEARFKRNSPFQVYQPTIANDDTSNNVINMQQDELMQQAFNTPETQNMEEVNQQLLPTVLGSENEKSDKNVIERALATGQDLRLSVSKGLVQAVEGLWDLGVSAAPYVVDLFSNDQAKIQKAKELARKEIEKDYATDFMNSKYVGAVFDPIGTALGKNEQGIYNQTIEDSYISEADWSQKYIRSTAESIGQMLPSIAMGNAVGALGGTQLASNVASITSFTGTAMGGSTEEALLEGADYDSAVAYGTISGAMEGVIEGISGVAGGVVSKGLIQGVMGKVYPEVTAKIMGNSFAKFALGAAGEGFEEIVSEIANPYIKRLTYDPDAPTATFEGCVEAFTLGALSSAILQGTTKLSKDSRIAELENDKNELLDMIADAQQKHNDPLAQNLMEIANKKSIKILEEVGKVANEQDVMLKNKMGVIDRIANKNNQKNKFKYTKVIDTLNQNVSEELNKMDKKKRRKFIEENDLNYIFDKNGNIKESYLKLSDERKNDIVKIQKAIKKLDSSTKIKYFEENKYKEGYYDRKTNTIYINMNASDPYHVVGMHEFTHSLEGTRQYENLRAFVLNQFDKNALKNELNKLDSLYGKQFEKTSKFKELNELLASNKITKEEYKKRLDTEYTAYLTEELVSNTISEKIFKDQETIERLVEEKPSLAKRIYRWIKEQLTQDRGTKEWNKTLKQAINIYKDAIQGKKNKVKTEEFLNIIKFNLRAAEDSENIKKMEEELVANKFSKENAEILINNYKKYVQIWKEISESLDSNYLNEWNSRIKDNRVFDIDKKQTGYKYNRELATMCAKGIPLFEAIDSLVQQEIMNKYPDITLSKEQKELLYAILKSHGFTIPCAACFVEQSRKREETIIDKFLYKQDNKIGWDSVLEEIEKVTGIKFKHLNRTIADGTDTYVRQINKFTKEEEAKIREALVPITNEEIKKSNNGKPKEKQRPLLKDSSMASIMASLKGNVSSNLKICKLLLTDPNSRFIIDKDLLFSSYTTKNLAKHYNALFKIFNSQGGVSTFKTKQRAEIYYHDELFRKLDSSKTKAAGGVRTFSNSDYQNFQFLDIMQYLTDLTIRKAYAQMYTKVIPYARIFGLSKAKINMSDIAQIKEYKNPDGTINEKKTRENAGLDANGNITHDPLEGIDWGEAFSIANDVEYSKNCCIISIGFSDKHIMKMLDDDSIQMIIGYHDKTNDVNKRQRGVRYAKNYNGENEAKNKNGKTIYPSFESYLAKATKEYKKLGKTINDIPRIATDLYLKEFEKGGKYEGGTPAYQTFSSHPNYYKLLANFGLYSVNSETGLHDLYAPHQKVEINIPDTIRDVSSKEYIERNVKSELDVIDSISEAMIDTGEGSIIKDLVDYVKYGNEAADIYKQSHPTPAMEYLRKKQKEQKEMFVNNTQEVDDTRKSIKEENEYTEKDYEDFVKHLDLEMVKQQYDSAKTSINSNKLPAIYTNKNVEFVDGERIIDYGGGRFDNAIKYAKDTFNTNVVVFDPFNRTLGNNARVLDSVIQEGKMDKALNSNVLNVIQEKEARMAVLRNIQKLVKPNGTIYITVYEGNGTGEGKVTSSGYQLNRKTEDYMDEIREVFPNAIRKGKLIIATNESSDIRYSIKEDSDGNKLTTNQEEYFKDSIVRDEQGNLQVMYHGSNAKFEAFDPNKVGKYGARYGYGYYLSSDFDVAYGYGNNIYRGYINLEKPLSIEKISISRKDLRKLLLALENASEESVLENFGNIYSEGKEKILNQTLDTFFESYESDLDIINDILDISGYRNSIDSFGKILKETTGYDGVVVEGIENSRQPMAIIFQSNQFKSLDNLNPTNDDRFRYSIKKDPTIEETKKLDSQRVKATANLNEDYYFEKKDTNQILTDVLESLSLYQDYRIKGGKTQTLDYLFQQMNTNKLSNEKIAREVADHLIKYAKIDKETIPTDLRDDIQKEIKKNIEKALLEKGKEGKVFKLKKVIERLQGQVKYYRGLNYVAHQITEKVHQLKDFAKMTYPHSQSAEHINVIFEEMANSIGKLNEKNVTTSEARDILVDFYHRFYNNSNKALEGYIDEGIISMLDDLQANQVKNPTSDLSIDELEYEKHIINAINHLIKEYNSVFVDGVKKNIDIETVKAFKQTQKVPQIKMGLFKKIIFSLSKFYDVVDMVSGAIMGEENTLKSVITNPLRNASTQEMKNIMELEEGFNEFFKDHKGYNNSLVNRQVVVGDTQMSLGEAISIYLLSKREQGRGHFMNFIKEDGTPNNPKGYRILDKKGNFVKYLILNQEDIDALYRKFNKEDLAYIDVVEDFFKKASKLQQDAEFKFQGYSNVDGSYYFPITTDRLINGIKKYGDARTPDQINSLFGIYFTKSLVEGANNSLRLESVDKIINRHKTLISKYNAYYQVVKNIQWFMNRNIVLPDGSKTTLRAETENKLAGFNAMLDTWISDTINISMYSIDGIEKAANKLKSNFAVSALALNFKVMVNQLSIIPTASAIISTESMSRGALMKNSKDSLKKMDIYCPYVKYRNYDSNVIAGKTNLGGKLNKFQQAIMKPIAQFDRLAIGHIWNACQLEIEKTKGLKFGTEENMKEAGKLLEEVIRKTQGIDSFEQPSLNRTHSGFTRALLMFQTQNMQSLSLLVDGFLERRTILARMKSDTSNKEFYQKALKENNKRIAKAFGGVATSNLIYVIIAMLFKKLLGKDDKEQNDILELGEDYVENTIGMIPIINNFTSKIFKGFDVKISFVDSLNTLIDSSKSLYKGMLSGNKDPRAMWYNFSNSLGQVAGIPAKNINEYGISVLQFISPDLAYKYRSLWYNKSVSKFTEDLENAIIKKDKSKQKLIIETIYSEKGIDIKDNSIVEMLSNVLSSDKIENKRIIFPRTANQSFVYNNQTYKLSDLNYRSFKKKYSSNINNTLKNLKTNLKFNSLNVNEKANAIRYLQDYAYFKAIGETLNLEWVDNKILSVSKAINPITIATTLAKCKGSLLGNRAAIQSYINSLPLSKVQKYMLYGIVGYKPLQDNAYTQVSNYLTTRGYNSDEVVNILKMCKLI